MGGRDKEWLKWENSVDHEPMVNSFGPRLVHPHHLSAYLYCSPHSSVCLHVVLEEAQVGPRGQGVTGRLSINPKITTVCRGASSPVVAPALASHFPCYSFKKAHTLPSWRGTRRNSRKQNQFLRFVQSSFLQLSFSIPYNLLTCITLA